jgi:hypothetical protein
MQKRLFQAEEDLLRLKDNCLHSFDDCLWRKNNLQSDKNNLQSRKSTRCPTKKIFFVPLTIGFGIKKIFLGLFTIVIDVWTIFFVTQIVFGTPETLLLAFGASSLRRGEYLFDRDHLLWNQNAF